MILAQKFQYKISSAEVKFNNQSRVRKMRKIFVTLLFVLILAYRVETYSIEGLWKLTSIEQSQVPQNSHVKMEVKDFVFRNTTLRWTLTLAGCQYLKSMLDIKGNSIFVDTSTIYLDIEKSQNCTSSLLAPEQKFHRLLKKTFTFQIISNFMHFTDPEGQVLFKFQRIPNNDSKINLKGSWMATLPDRGKLSQMLEITETQLIFCQRLVQINYTVPTANKIQINNTQNIPPACKTNDLLGLIKDSLYFVQRNHSLQLYNDKDQVAMSLVFIMDLESAKKLRDEQQKEKEKAAITASLLPPPVSISPTLTPIFTLSDFIGKWSISKVFSGPSLQKNMVFIITKDAFLISGDCNTYTFIFSVVGASPIKVKRQSFRQTQNACSNEDEQIYKNGLIKLTFVNPQMDIDKITIKLQDDKGQQLFLIEKPNEGKAFVGTPTPSQPILPKSALSSLNLTPPQFPTPSANSIPNGKYTVLLLMRRDIPKKIITIKNNSFTLKICNQIQVVISLRGEAMDLKTEVKTSNSCDTAQENLFLTTLGKVRTGVKDELDFILKDSSGKQIVTLNFVG